MPTIGWLTVSAAESAAENTYLAGHWKQVVKWSQTLAEVLEDYLLGDWLQNTKTEKGKIDPGHWFESPSPQGWVSHLESGLAWAAVAGHWQSVDRLLVFPQPKIQADDGKKAVREYYLGLARWWKDPSDLAWIDDVKQAGGAGSKNYHVLCDAVAAITATDAKALGKALTKNVQDFLKLRKHDSQFPWGATFLWNVARRNGLKCTVAEGVAPFLFELPEFLDRA